MLGDQQVKEILLSQECYSFTGLEELGYITDWRAEQVTTVMFLREPLLKIL